MKVHNYWSNIFRSKADMHLYFSEAVFDSESDTKIEYRELWKNSEYVRNTESISELDENVRVN